MIVRVPPGKFLMGTPVGSGCRDEWPQRGIEPAVVDVGQSLGVGAHLVQLRRTKIGQLDVAKAFALDDLLAAPALDGKIIPLAAALPLLS